MAGASASALVRRLGHEGLSKDAQREDQSESQTQLRGLGTCFTTVGNATTRKRVPHVPYTCCKAD